MFISANKLAEFSDYANHYTLNKIRQKMSFSEEGKRILDQQPRVNSIQIKKLLSLPENTFGYKYAAFMDKFDLKPEERPLVRYMDDYELAYIKQRYTEIHDFIHVILGYNDISILSELKVKQFESIHFGFAVSL